MHIDSFHHCDYVANQIVEHNRFIYDVRYQCDQCNYVARLSNNLWDGVKKTRLFLGTCPISGREIDTLKHLKTTEYAGE